MFGLFCCAVDSAVDRWGNIAWVMRVEMARRCGGVALPAIETGARTSGSVIAAETEVQRCEADAGCEIDLAQTLGRGVS